MLFFGFFMSVSIRREVTFNQGYTVIVFDKDHFYSGPLTFMNITKSYVYTNKTPFMKELITTIQIGKNY